MTYEEKRKAIVDAIRRADLEQTRVAEWCGRTRRSQYTYMSMVLSGERKSENVLEEVRVALRKNLPSRISEHCDALTAIENVKVG